MRSWAVKALFLGLAVLLMAPVPAAAQDGPGKLGAGLSFLSDDGTGVGFTVDYSKPVRSLADNRTLGWVGDFSFHHDDGVDVITLQGGVRFAGQLGANPNLTWHAQGILGLLHASADGDGESRFIFSPGAGIDYAFTERTAFRTQVDFPLGDDVSAVRFWIGISQKVGQ
jgi:hypothetical protein